MRNRGRPSTWLARCNRVISRLSDEEMEMLDYICEKERLSKSTVVRECIRMRYKLALYQD